jgi:hypothetical protein
MASIEEEGDEELGTTRSEEEHEDQEGHNEK